MFLKNIFSLSYAKVSKPTRVLRLPRGAAPPPPSHVSLLTSQFSYQNSMASLFRHPLTRSIPNSFTRFRLRPRRTMSSSSAQRLFQLKLDPLTGNSEWVVIDEEDQVSENPSEPLLSTTSYLDMLNDSRRNRAFREAIDKTVTKNCRVLDIGYLLYTLHNPVCGLSH